MARDRANINTGIWTDDEFIDITRDEQWLYFLLMTDPKLSYAGVTDWRPGRIAQRSSNTTKEDIEQAGAMLQAGRYIFIDEDTEEVLVRSFLRHDGLLKQPRLGVSMFNAYGSIASKDIRKVVIHELKRLHDEFPEWKAFGVDKVRELLKLSSADMSEFTPSVTPGFTPNATQGQGMHTSTATSTSTSKDVEGSGESQSRAVRLPDGWQPTDAHKKFAAENSLNLDNEIANFRDHAQANDRRQKNWDASFRMWLRKATEYQARRTAQPSQHMTASQRRLQEGYEREQRILSGELSFDNTDNPYLQPRPQRQAIEGGTTWTPEQQ